MKRTDLWTLCLVCFFSAILCLASGYKYKHKGYRDDNDANEVLSKPKNKWSTYSGIWQYYLKRTKPWLLLADHGGCFQQTCDITADCCRKYNICDRSAHVCIDCWHGYPCRTSADCCERYPECRKEGSDDTGRCQK